MHRSIIEPSIICSSFLPLQSIGNDVLSFGDLLPHSEKGKIAKLSYSYVYSSTAKSLATILRIVCKHSRNSFTKYKLSENNKILREFNGSLMSNSYYYHQRKCLIKSIILQMVGCQ